MKKENYHNLDVKDIIKKINESKIEINKIYSEIKLGKIKNIHLVKNERKKIARLNTVLNEKLDKEKL